jgi:hypothetical protein
MRAMRASIESTHLTCAISQVDEMASPVGDALRVARAPLSAR